MLRKNEGKPALRDDARRSKKIFLYEPPNVSNCGVAHRVNSAESRLARAQYLSTGHYVFTADGVYDSGS